jgi:peptidoglycan hydrolase CwlO-like protein
MTKCSNCKDYQEEIRSLQITLNNLEFKVLELEKELEKKNQQIRKLKQK